MSTNQQLLQAATEWHKKGIPVIPFILVWNQQKQTYNKQPATSWKQWQTKPQTTQEFTALHIERYTMFAILCGTKIITNTETFYLVGVDRDIKDPVLSEETKEKSLQALNLLRNTYREKTRSGGNHLLYFSRTPAKTVKLTKAGMALIGSNELLVVAPSEGYIKENNYPITRVDSAEAVFYAALEQVGLTKKQNLPNINLNQENPNPIQEPRPCIIEALKLQLTGTNGYLMQLAIAAEYKKLGYTNTEITELFRSQHDFNHEALTAKLEDVNPQKTVSCQSIKEYGFCLPNCRNEKPIVLEHINDVENPLLTGKPVTVEAVVSSTSISYMVPSEVTAVTRAVNQKTEVDCRILKLDNPLNLSLVAIPDETKLGRLRRLFKDKVLSIEVEKCRAVYSIRVRPPVFSLLKQGSKLVDDKGREYKYLDIYVATDKPLTFQPSEHICVTGLPLPHPRTQKTTLLAYEVGFPEKIEKFNTQKLQQLQTKFADKTPRQRLQWILDNCERYTHIVGRKNIATAVLLCAFTPMYVRLFGEVQRGWGLVDIIGDSTVGKSETVKKIVLGLLKAGMYVTAETASIVGLVGAAVQGESGGWFVEWGFLPLMDQKILALDGCHKLSAAQWAITAEAERSGEVTIIKAGKGNAYARTRQIKIYNAVDREVDRYGTKPLSEFLYPIQALATVEDKTSIARRDFAVFADQRDVSAEQINRPAGECFEVELEFLCEVLKWAWLGYAEVMWDRQAEFLLLKRATELVDRFYFGGVPLVSADMKWKLARLTVAMAYLTLSTTDFSKLNVTEEHLELTCEVLTEEYTRAGLNVLAQSERLERLTVKDVEQLLVRVHNQLCKEPLGIAKLVEVLRFIVLLGGVTQEQLKIRFELAEKNQLRPLMAVLQTEGLVRVNRGYYPSGRLVEAYKVSGGFACCACCAAPKKEPPPQTCGSVS